MIYMCQPLFGTGKAVVLDSEFGAEKGIFELGERGVYASALIKKRKYWPKNVPEDSINGYFVNTDVVGVDMFGGKDGRRKAICDPYIKEPDYFTNIMEFSMNLDELEEKNQDYTDNEGCHTRNSFTYRQPFGLHVRYHHQVDDHNNHRHAPIYLERT